MRPRPLLMALALLALSLVAGGSAKAQAMDDTCLHAPTIQSLADCVQHATDQGVIDNAGVTTSLLSTLDAAQAALDRDQPTVAVHTLQALIAAVNAQAGISMVGTRAIWSTTRSSWCRRSAHSRDTGSAPATMTTCSGQGQEGGDRVCSASWWWTTIQP